MNEAVYEDRKEAAENLFFQSVSLRRDKEIILNKLSDLRDYANQLGRKLAHPMESVGNAEELAKRALMAREWEDVKRELEDLAEILGGIHLVWTTAPADKFAEAYEHVEIETGDGNTWRELL